MSDKSEQRDVVKNANFDDAKSASEKNAVTVFSIDGNYDTRKEINRSDKVIPIDKIEEIEKNGLSIEDIESLGVPVFKYKTQVTIHGNFTGLTQDRLAGYKVFTLNQNKTLGVRYNGVDTQKKQLIKNSIYLYRVSAKDKDSSWNYRTDSTGTFITLSLIVNGKDRDEMIADFNKKKKQAGEILNSIPKNLFIGDSWVNMYSYFGAVVINVNIDLKAIYEKNVWDFISFLTYSTIKNKKEYDSYADAELKRREQEAKLSKEAYEKERIAENERFNSEKEKLQESNPYKDNLMKMSDVSEKPNELIFGTYYKDYKGAAKIKIYYVNKDRQWVFAKIIQDKFNNFNDVSVESVKKEAERSYGIDKQQWGKVIGKVKNLIEKGHEYYLIKPDGNLSVQTTDKKYKITSKDTSHLDKKTDEKPLSGGGGTYYINDRGNLEMKLEYNFYQSLPESEKQRVRDNFMFSKYNKSWYKKSSITNEQAEKIAISIGVGGSSDDVKSSDVTVSDHKKLDLKDLYEKGKKPRKDVIISEIEAGKMEYAVRRKFDSMHDIHDYINVRNDSFMPAEEAFHRKESKDNFLIEQLKSAMGQSHWVYSATIIKDDVLGYCIDFGDYYIRYKGEKGEKEDEPIVEDENTSDVDDRYMKFDFRNMPNQHDKDFVSEIKNYVEIISDSETSINAIKFKYKNIEFYLFDNGGEFKIDDLTNGVYFGIVYFTENDIKKSPYQLVSEVIEALDQYISERLSFENIKSVFPDKFDSYTTDRNRLRIDAENSEYKFYAIENKDGSVDVSIYQRGVDVGNVPTTYTVYSKTLSMSELKNTNFQDIISNIENSYKKTVDQFEQKVMDGYLQGWIASGMVVINDGQYISNLAGYKMSKSVSENFDIKEKKYVDENTERIIGHFLLVHNENELFSIKISEKEINRNELSKNLFDIYFYSNNKEVFSSPAIDYDDINSIIQENIEDYLPDTGKSEDKHEKNAWEITLPYLRTVRSEKDFPLESSYEIIDERPIYKFSTTVKWGDDYKTFTYESKNQARPIEKLHKMVIEKALSEGKPVPAEVLEDYPELKPKEKDQKESSVKMAKAKLKLMQMDIDIMEMELSIGDDKMSDGGEIKPNPDYKVGASSIDNLTLDEIKDLIKQHEDEAKRLRQDGKNDKDLTPAGKFYTYYNKAYSEELKATQWKRFVEKKFGIRL